MYITEETCPKYLPIPIEGRWPFDDYPEEVVLNYVDNDGINQAVTLTQSDYVWPNSQAVKVYRATAHADSLHLDVFKDGTFRADHLDCSNPDISPAHAAEHLRKDVLQAGLQVGPLVAWGGLALGVLVIASLVKGGRQ